MTTKNHTLLRNSILLQLEHSNPATLPASTLLQGLHLAGFKNTPTQDLQKEIQYLQDIGLIAQEQSKINPTEPRFRIHSSGRDYLSQENLS